MTVLPLIHLNGRKVSVRARATGSMRLQAATSTDGQVRAAALNCRLQVARRSAVGSERRRAGCMQRLPQMRVVASSGGRRSSGCDARLRAMAGASLLQVADDAAMECTGGEARGLQWAARSRAAAHTA